MRLRIRTRTIAAMLSVCCVVIAVALYAQAPADMPTQSVGQPAERTISNTPAGLTQVNDLTTEPSASAGSANAPTANAHTPSQARRCNSR